MRSSTPFCFPEPANPAATEFRVARDVPRRAMSYILDLPE